MLELDNLMQRLLNLNGTVRKPWYVGRPVMVTQNDYRQNLFNGDIGIYPYRITKAICGCGSGKKKVGNTALSRRFVCHSTKLHGL